MLANGDDPGVAKQEQKLQRKAAKEQTFAHLVQKFMEKVRKEGKAQAAQDKTTWLLDMANADFGKKPIAEITSPMVLACLRKVEAKGNYETAKRLRAEIGSVFRFAVAIGVPRTPSARPW